MRFIPKRWWRIPLFLLVIYMGWVAQLHKAAMALANNRLHDRADVLPLYDHLLLEIFLQRIDDESGVDIRFLFVPGVAGQTLEAYSVRMARDLGVGRENDRRGLLLVYDVPNGRLRLEVGAQMEPIITDAFAGYLMRAHMGGSFGAGDPSVAARTTLFIIQHRLREAALGQGYDPTALQFITDSRRLAVGGGASGDANTDTAVVFLNKPRAESRTIRAHVAPQPTPAAAYNRYLEWLARGNYETDLPLFTPASRQHLSRFPMTRGYHDHILMMEYGESYEVDTRHDLAMLIFTANPLLSPHFFRLTPEGWMMDIVTEIQNTRNYSGFWYTWGLLDRGDDFAVTFADRYLRIGNIYRIDGGDNRPLSTKTAGAVQAPLTSHSDDNLQHITVGEAAQQIGAAKARTLVVLYDIWTRPARDAFPAFVATATRCRRAGVEVLAFNTDRKGRALRRLPSFLVEHGAPFDAVHLIPWEPGKLSGAMAPLGVRVASSWMAPILAVRDGPSGVRLQTEGWEEFTTSAERLVAACEAH